MVKQTTVSALEGMAFWVSCHKTSLVCGSSFEALVAVKYVILWQLHGGSACVSALQLITSWLQVLAAGQVFMLAQQHVLSIHRTKRCSMLDNHTMHKRLISQAFSAIGGHQEFCHDFISMTSPCVSSCMQYHACHYPMSAKLAYPLLLPEHDQEGNTAVYSQAEEFLKRYLEYCRVKCSPRLTQRAAATLVTDYVEIRDEVRTCTSKCTMLATDTLLHQTAWWLHQKAYLDIAMCLQQHALLHSANSDCLGDQHSRSELAYRCGQIRKRVVVKCQLYPSQSDS